jgi:hypothetical protein
MDTIDLLAEERLITPAGLIAISLASHDDGTLSVVARLLATGERVGFGRCPLAQGHTARVALDRRVASPTVEQAMRRLLRTTGDPRLSYRFARRRPGAGGHARGAAPTDWRAYAALDRPAAPTGARLDTRAI